MKISRRITSLFLVLALLVISTSTGFAKTDEETLQVLSSNGRTIKVSISPILKSMISTEELSSFVNSIQGADNVTILDVGYAVPNTTSIQNSNLAPMGITLISPPVKNYTAYDAFESDRFMASCAKGETKTISTTITAKLSSSMSGTIMGNYSLNLAGEISYSISSGTTLAGPPESSPYNSRQYRCKFYQNRGNWGQAILIDGIDLSRSGTFSEPTKYVSYSTDTYA